MSVFESLGIQDDCPGAAGWLRQLSTGLPAEVMISQFATDSVLTAQSLEPALDSVSPSFSVPAHILSLSQKRTSTIF